MVVELAAEAVAVGVAAAVAAAVAVAVAASQNCGHLIAEDRGVVAAAE